MFILTTRYHAFPTLDLRSVLSSEVIHVVWFPSSHFKASNSTIHVCISRIKMKMGLEVHEGQM